MVRFGSIVFIGTLLSAVFGYDHNNNEYLYTDIFPAPPTPPASVSGEDVAAAAGSANSTVWATDEGVYQNMEREVEQQCYCTPYYSCETFVSTSDGAGFINIRMPLGQCESYLDVCCQHNNSTENSISSSANNNTTSHNHNNTDDTEIHQHHGQELETSSPDEEHTSSSTSPADSNDVSSSTVITPVTENTQKTDSLKNVIIGHISSVTNHLTQLLHPESHSVVPTESTDVIKTHETPDESVITTAPDYTSSGHHQPVHKCGIWNKYGVGFRIFNDIDGEAQYSEYPSMVAVFEQEDLKNGEKRLVLKCGGSLIKPNVVLTAAHCVIKSQRSKLIIRAGDWDLKTERELYPNQEIRVSKIITHNEYYSGGLHNDIALIFTETNFTLEENVQIMCLPEEDENFTDTRCFSTGWGKTVSYNNYTLVKKTETGSIHEFGQYEVSILKKVELPIVAHDECQKSLKSTRLGPKFMLHDSFLCAGGERGKDTCKGDGGSPLMCPSKDDPNHLVQVGIVSWGIECGLENIPGVYVDVPRFRKWIDREIENYVPAVSQY